MLKISTYFLKSYINVKSIFVNNIIFVILISLYFFIVIFTDSFIYSTKTKINNLLSDEHNINIKNDIGVLLQKEDSKEIYIKKVNKDYFNDDILKLLSINKNDINKVFSKTNKTQLITSKIFNNNNGAVITSTSPRGVVVEVNNIFNTGFSSFDKNIVYMCYDNLDNVKEYNVNNDIIDEIYSRFYSSIDSSLQSIKLLNIFLLILSAFFSISIIQTFLNSNTKYFKYFYIEGVKEKSILFSSVFVTEVLLIIILSFSFIISLIIVKLLPMFIFTFEKYLGLNFNYYLKSFNIYIDIHKILINSLLLFLFNLFYNIIKNLIILKKVKNDRIF